MVSNVWEEQIAYQVIKDVISMVWEGQIVYKDQGCGLYGVGRTDSV